MKLPYKGLYVNIFFAMKLFADNRLKEEAISLGIESMRRFYSKNRMPSRLYGMLHPVNGGMGVW
jgi:hypothetical protein